MRITEQNTFSMSCFWLIMTITYYSNCFHFKKKWNLTIKLCCEIVNNFMNIQILITKLDSLLYSILLCGLAAWFKDQSGKKNCNLWLIDICSQDSYHVSVVIHDAIGWRRQPGTLQRLHHTRPFQPRRAQVSFSVKSTGL